MLLLASGCPEGGGEVGSLDAAVEPAPSALLEAIKGAATLQRAGQKAPARLGYLYVGDALETGSDAEARVRFPGGRVIELGPDGRFELKAGEGGLLLNVDRGLVLTRVEADAPSRPLPGGAVQLSISTPFGLTRVGADSVAVASVNVGASSTSVDVTLGTLELVSRNGEVSKVGAGQKGALGLPTITLPAVELVILPGPGKAELKKKDEKKWQAVNGKGPTPMSEGDALRVKAGRTTVQADGSQVRYTFAQGTEVVMGSSAVGAGVEESSMDFAKGELTVVSPASQKNRLKLPGGVTLVSDLGSQYTLRRTKDGYELVSTVADVKVLREGQSEQVVFGGRVAQVPEKGELKVDEVPRETVVLPSRTGLRVFHAGVGRVALSWDAQTDAPVRIEVSTDAAYQQLLVSGVVHQRYFNVPAPARGPLYWRVLDGEQEFARGSASFAPEPKSADLERSRNEVVDGAEKTTIYFQDKPPAVTFTWLPADDAVNYKVAVFKEGQFSTPVAERTVKAESVALAEGVLVEGKYTWSVTGVTAKGESLAGGKMNKLEITYDNAVPTLIIKSPRNQDPGGPRVRCVGIAPVGSRVFINGRPVTIEDKGRFDVEVAPLGRFVVFRLLNAGAEVYTVRTVLRGK